MRHSSFKIAFFVFLAAAGFAGTGLKAQDSVAADPKVSFFYDALLPYGDWIWVTNNGWCWRPNDVAYDWRPYSDGQWIDSQFGWTWLSDEPWGWACFHYGRWFFDSTDGWMWVPDTVWAPAWVVWEYGDDWIGWAPCPLEFGWQSGFGFSYTAGDFDDIPSFWFCFVADRDFRQPHLARYVSLPMRNPVLRRTVTAVVGNYRIENGEIVNRVPIDDTLERATGRPVRRFRITDADSFRNPAGISGDEVRIYRPRTDIILSTTPRMIPRLAHQERLRQFPPADRQTLMQRHTTELKTFYQNHQNQRTILMKESVRMIKQPPLQPAQDQGIDNNTVQKNALDEREQREFRLLQERQRRQLEDTRSYDGGGGERESGRGGGERRRGR